MATLPADAVNRINETRRHAEFDLRARLEPLDGSEITPYLAVFITFAITLFDAEADEFAGTCRDSSDLAKILRTDLKTRIVESILPDQSLKSALKHQPSLSERRPIVREVGSQIIYEEAPGGELTIAREQVQAAFALHGYWERFMPPHIGLLIRSRDNARVREELTQSLGRRVTYWLGHFDYRTQPPTSFVSELEGFAGDANSWESLRLNSAQLRGDCSDTQQRELEEFDPFQEDGRPLGENPFPPEHPAHAAFEEATWTSTTRVAQYKLDFMRANCPTHAEFIKSILTFRKRWFTTVAFEATLIVGDEETAHWYENWIGDRAKWLVGDTLAKVKRKDPKADPASPPFFSPNDIEFIERDLTFELLQMVTHYKGEAAARVVEVIGLRAAERVVTEASPEALHIEGSEGEGSVSSPAAAPVAGKPQPEPQVSESFPSGTNDRPSSVDNADDPSQPAEVTSGRRRLIDSFLASCNNLSQVRVRRAHIWRLVGHATARQFEYWQAEMDRPSGETRGATEQDDQNFRRVLAMKPTDFLSQLGQKGLLKSAG